MAALSALLAAERRNAWRTLRARGRWKSADAATLLAGLAGLAAGQAAVSGLALVLLRQGPGPGATSQGLSGPDVLGRLLAEASLLVLLAAWLLLPVLSTGLEVRGRSLSPAQLVRFPVRPRTLLLASVLSTLARPPYLALLLVSGLAFVPLLGLAHPVAALLLALPFLVFSMACSWGIGLAVNAFLTAPKGRALALGSTCALSLMLLLPLGLRPERTQNGIETQILGRQVLLLSRDGLRGALPVMARAAPSSAVVAAGRRGLAPEPVLHVLAAALLAGAGASWAFRRSLRHPRRSWARAREQRLVAAVARVPGLRDPLRALTEKEAAFLLRTMDAPVGLVIGLVGAGFALLAEPALSRAATWILPAVLLFEAAMPFNTFGLDRAGQDRYRLAPVTARLVILSKNVAWWWVVLLQTGPLLVALLSRHGLRFALSVAAGHAAVVLAMTAWGNVVSVRAPTPREFWNFDSFDQAGGVTSLLFGLLVAVGVGAAASGAAAADATLGTGGLALPTVTLAMAAMAGAAWAPTVSWCGREFERSPDRMRRGLTA